MKGYRVFRSNSLHEEFTEVTRRFLDQPLFTDHLPVNTLEKYIYYYVVAADEHYNNSLPSAIIKLRRPDTIPPVAPVIKLMLQDENGICLEWNRSSSDDLKEILLVRSVNNMDSIIPLPNHETSVFSDTNVIPGNTIGYYFVAVDSAGNRSRSAAVRIYYETGSRPAPTLEAEVSRENKSILLMWEVPPAEIYCTHIYRAKNDGSFRLIKTVKGSLGNYKDKNLPINNFYRYKIQLVYTNGIRSEQSEEVLAEY